VRSKCNSGFTRSQVLHTEWPIAHRMDRRAISPSLADSSEVVYLVRWVGFADSPRVPTGQHHDHDLSLCRHGRCGRTHRPPHNI